MIQKLLLTTALMFAAAAPQAAVVTGDFAQLSGNTWTAAFSVTNDGAQASIGGFSVFFDYGAATNLALVTSPSAWDTLVLQPDNGLAVAGFMDAVVIEPAGGLAIGQQIGGFSVRFDWSTNPAPNSFHYTINDLTTFESLEIGTTVAANLPVPEPATWILFAAGILAITTKRLNYKI